MHDFMKVLAALIVAFDGLIFLNPYSCWDNMHQYTYIFVTAQLHGHQLWYNGSK